MTRLLIDTNIVIDLLSEREPFYTSSAQVFSLGDKGKLDLSVSSLTFANTNYILSRQKTPKEAREILRRFRILVKVLSLNDKIIDLALNDSNYKDFEDGIQYYTAIENEQEIILTRDLQGFKESKIPVMTADEFLSSL
jgi:predicted nucleic acid-binding protein